MDVPLLSAVEQLALLRNRHISAQEIAEEYILRIHRLNPILNAFTHFDPDAVRAQAANAANGTLQGLPLSVKSSIEVAGMPCEIGSTLRRGVIATQDAGVVAHLKAAGAVILGTTNCPEFLMSYDTANDLHGRTNNPCKLDRSAGGSSGGEAAAIAACMSAGGLGSDSGGSVRVPAHFTGICALKPTPERVSSMGHQPPCVGPFSSLGAIGPMARTMEDVDLLFRAVARNDPHHPIRTAPSLQTLRSLPVAWLDEDGQSPVTPETAQAVQGAASELERQGFTLKRLRSSMLQELQRLWRIFFLQCGEMFYRSTVQGQEHALSLHFKEFLHEAHAMPPLGAPELLAAWADMDRVRVAFWQELGHCLLLTPVCSVPAFRHGERAWQIADRTVTYWEAMRFTQWFNLLACPAAVVPVAQSPEGLPIGVQVAGPPFYDEEVLALAGLLQTEGYVQPPIINSEGSSWKI